MESSSARPAQTETFRSLALRFEDCFDIYSDRLAMRWRERGSEIFYEMNYRQLAKKVRGLATALVELGIERQESIGLIADVSPEWTIADLAIQLIGAVDVPRGTDSTAEDLGYIIRHSGARTVFVHYSSEIDKIERGLAARAAEAAAAGTDDEHARPAHEQVQRYIVLNDHVSEKHAERAVAFSDLIDRGEDLIFEKAAVCDEVAARIQSGAPEDLAAIVYTSGTTGVPKGVLLTQSNFSFQLNRTPEVFALDPDRQERGMNLLPPWHIFGRAVEYNLLLVGASITYTDIRHLAQDMRDIRPTFFPAVPRIWEGFYNKIYAGLKAIGKEETFLKYRRSAVQYAKAKRALRGKERIFVRRGFAQELLARLSALGRCIYYFIPKRMGDLLIFRKLVDATGGEIRVPVAGGSALPYHVDEFFEAIGIPIREGYGLTETCAVVSIRPSDHIVSGTVGLPVNGLEVRLIDEAGQDVTHIPDAQGTLHTRGPHVMRGYYKEPEKTAAVLDSDGWFNTGDVVKITVHGDLCIVGRSKDTVVLAGGENVEPTPIEEKLKQSDYIDHVMIVGQDQKTLAALIVPDEDELGQYARRLGIRSTSLNAWLEDPRVRELYKKEIAGLINRSEGFKSFEHVTDFRLLSKRFEKGDELNNTMKIRRHVVTQRYQHLIDEIYGVRETADRS